MAVAIELSRFANAGDKGAAVIFEGTAHGSLVSNLFAGARTKKAVEIAPDARVLLQNNVSIWGAPQVEQKPN